MKFNYTLTTSDFRAALYFGTTVRMQKQIKFAAMILVVSAVYAFGGYLKLYPYIMLPAYVGMAYLVWLAYIIARAEHTVLKYIKSKDNILGKKMLVTLNDDQFIVETEGCVDKTVMKVRDLFMVFETSGVFNIYLNPLQTVLLPKRAMSEAETEAVRGIFGRKLKERFETRFGLKLEKMPLKIKLFKSPLEK